MINYCYFRFYLLSCYPSFGFFSSSKTRNATKLHTTIITKIKVNSSPIYKRSFTLGGTVPKRRQSVTVDLHAANAKYEFLHYLNILTETNGIDKWLDLN